MSTQISAKDVKALRDRTNAGMMDCKKALLETGGDQEKAADWLRKKGLSEVSRKAGRVAAEGAVSSYIHMGGRIGVLVEINCESDFVARGDVFQQFVKEVAMHIAAASPKYLDQGSVPSSAIEAEREVYRAQVREQGKPEKMVEQIVEGKLKKWFAEVCLHDQPWIKEAKMSIEELRAECVQKTGENVSIRRFERFVLGEGIEKKQENLLEEVAKMQDAVRT